MAAPMSGTGNPGPSQPLLLTPGSSYGGVGQTSTQTNPAVDRAIDVLKLMAARQSQPQPIPSFSQVTAQQTLTLQEGQYVGDAKDGLPHGRGTMTYNPGMVRKKYEGEWQNGKCHGRGTMIFVNKNIYVGDMEDNELTGQGECSYHDGKKYSGSFLKGNPDGRGTMTYAPGEEHKEYSGCWKDGKFHGKGVLKMSDGTRYEGNWEDGKQHGKGMIFFANGAKYEGDFVKGKCHGKGTRKGAYGEDYSGSWENGKPNGYGTLAGRYGTYTSGTWVDGTIDGEGEQVTSTGTFKGTFKDGKRWTGTWEEVSGHRGTYESGERKTNLCSCSLL